MKKLITIAYIIIILNSAAIIYLGNGIKTNAYLIAGVSDTATAAENSIGLLNSYDYQQIDNEIDYRSFEKECAAKGGTYNPPSNAKGGTLFIYSSEDSVSMDGYSELYNSPEQLKQAEEDVIKEDDNGSIPSCTVSSSNTFYGPSNQ